MNRDVLDHWCERGILALVLAILVFGPLAFGAVRAFEFSIIQGLTAGVMLLWVIRLWLDPHPQLLWPPICWAVLAFAGYSVARYLTADIEYIARQELLHVLVYAFLFFAILNNLHRQENTQIISFTLIFLAMAIAFYGLYQFLANSDRVWTFIKPYPHRASGTYICPNHLAGFLEMILPLALAYTLAGRVKALTRVFIGYAALVIVAGIAVTVSRGGWISTATALLVFFAVLLARRHYRLPALALLAVLVVGGVYFVPRSYFLQMRIKQLAEEKNPTHEDMRFALWRPAIQMWQDHFWWGAGPGHFDARFRQYRPEAVQLSPDRAHNDYLNTFADYGLVGTLLVASAWGFLVLGLLQTRNSVRFSPKDLGGKFGSNKFAFVLGSSLGLLAILVHSVVDFNMHIPANAILAVTLMALLTGHLRFATERYWVRARLPVRVPITLALFAGLTWIVPQAWRGASEFVWLQRAQQSLVASPAQREALEKAFAIEPRNPQTAYDLGEAFRRQSQEGGEYYAGQAGVDYRTLATEAMTWFKRGMQLNPWDSRNFAGYAWCLDWLERSAESAPYFSQAEALDPNNYYNLNMIGLHYVQLGDFAAAKPWFERSLRLERDANTVAQSYLQIANIRLMEAATNEITRRLDFSPR